MGGNKPYIDIKKSIVAVSPMMEKIETDEESEIQDKFYFFSHFFHLFNSSIHLKHGDIGIPKTTAVRCEKNRGIKEDS